MTIKLFGWDGQTNNFEIGELSEIDCAGMCVCDGREYLTVIYKNGKSLHTVTIPFTAITTVVIQFTILRLG